MSSTYDPNKPITVTIDGKVKCPVCKGEGVTEEDIWRGDLVGYESAPTTCIACNGEKVIPIEDLEYYS